MGYQYGKKMRVYVQMDDRMFYISGDVRDITITYPQLDITELGNIKSFIPSGIVETNIHLIGTGGNWSLVDDFTPKIEKQKHSEWKCDFCGHVNSNKARYCGHKDKHAVGCGARRSFLMDI
jgi:hypothetical protein